jgi:hypothetical protein
MQVRGAAVSQDAIKPVVKISSCGCSEGEIAKALKVSAKAISEGQYKSSEFENQNPATKRLVHFVNESYAIMAESLAQQIQKVLNER